jgi:hypothetical protein
MSTTNVPSPTFGATGFIPQTEAAILAGVIEDIQAAFGGNLNLSATNTNSLKTPQGQLASSQTAIIGTAQDQFCQLANSVDPAFATGRMQDAIGRIYYLTRIPATATVCESCTCSGAVGTVIPVNSIAVDQGGNLYLSTESAVIASNGSVVIPFACVTTGPIACPIGYLNAIYQAIPGWDSITNTAAGVVGSNVESQYAFELRRQQSVALNALQMIQAVQGNVLQVPGVIDAYSYDNSTGAAYTILGVTIAAASIYVCVSGGIDTAVGYAIWQKKGGGCGYTGNHSVTVYDTNSGYVAPYPSYTVTFQIPTSLPFIFSVSLANNSGIPSNATTLIQAAIQTAFAGNDGGPRARIGSQVFASRFYAGIAALGTWAQIRSIQIGSTNIAAAYVQGAISGTTLTITSVFSGAVAIGQYLFDTTGNILVGTYVVSGSGSTWVVSQTQTVASEPITLAVAGLNVVQVNINQIPTLSNGNIGVTIT